MYINSKPRIYEQDNSYATVFPHEARIRNLTYATEMYLDLKVDKIEKYYDGKELKERREPISDKKNSKVLIGRVPVMVRSEFCHLKD